MAGKTVNIPMGSSTDQIVQKLQASGIIQNSAALKLYIKLQGVGSLIKAGDYQFPSPISSREVVQKLVEGGSAANKLTIIEGWTRWDIAHAMAAIPTLKLKSADQALALMNDTSSIKDLDPTATSLEGYMFPDTYFVQTTTTAKQLLESSVEHFHQVWNKDLASIASSNKQTPHQIVTIASIIETEAKLADERPVVASVIYNRLRKNIPLSVDSTIVYASKLAGKWHNNGIVYLSDVNRESPYNTRKVTGLPPGPVSNPGLSSLKAALAPTNTGFIYYVREPSRNDGAHNFYVDAAGFELGVQALRNWEKQHRGATATQSKPNAAKPTSTPKPNSASNLTPSGHPPTATVIAAPSPTASLKSIRAIPKAGKTTQTATPNVNPGQRKVTTSPKTAPVQPKQSSKHNPVSNGSKNTSSRDKQRANAKSLKASPSKPVQTKTKQVSTPKHAPAKTKRSARHRK